MYDGVEVPPVRQPPDSTIYVGTSSAETQYNVALSIEVRSSIRFEHTLDRFEPLLFLIDFYFFIKQLGRETTVAMRRNNFHLPRCQSVVSAAMCAKFLVKRRQTP